MPSFSWMSHIGDWGIGYALMAIVLMVCGTIAIREKNSHARKFFEAIPLSGRIVIRKFLRLLQLICKGITAAGIFIWTWIKAKTTRPKQKAFDYNSEFQTTSWKDGYRLSDKRLRYLKDIYAER